MQVLTLGRPGFKLWFCHLGVINKTLGLNLSQPVNSSILTDITVPRYYSWQEPLNINTQHMVKLFLKKVLCIQSTTTLEDKVLYHAYHSTHSQWYSVNTMIFLSLCLFWSRHQPTSLWELSDTTLFWVELPAHKWSSSQFGQLKCYTNHPTSCCL